MMETDGGVAVINRPEAAELFADTDNRAENTKITESGSPVATVEAEVKTQTDTVTKEIVVAKKPVYSFVKRVFDIIVSFVCLIVGSPIYLIVALAIFIDDPGNPFYAQLRSGKNNKTFRMYKFRSMYKDAEKRRNDLLSKNEADGPIFKIADDPRVTKVGKFIRKTSIDELPQLLNVLKGDMSLVGPRPLPTYEQAACNEYQNQRLLVIPGLTCYTALDKHSEEDFDNWIELDMKYIRERSLLTDIKILFGTVGVVLRHKNY